ncbi:MAG: CcmD family protein [bacterium]|nr:CcmD family protein [bacterium]
MKNFYFLFSAYSVTWLVFFWYLYSLWRKQERIERGIQRISEQLRGK